MLAPLDVHAAPDAATPLSHEQVLMLHSVLSVLGVHPALHVATAQPNSYELAWVTLQATKYTYEHNLYIYKCKL